MKPIYDIKKSYLENAEEGPFFEETFPERPLPPQEQWHDFLGFKVASKIGVPAGPLLNARWVSFAAAMGFDIVTYKTIRSQSHPAHPVPNMVYVETPGFLRAEQEGEVLRATEKRPVEMEALALTNSFGIPSRDHSYLVGDIDLAKKSLRPGQVMIVSVVGTPRPGEDFVEDFVRAAAIAVEGGAAILEADFSCPNVLSCEGSIHTSPDSVYTISKRMKEAYPHIPLVIKVGVIQNKEVLRKVMTAAARAGVDALCGINTMSMRVVNAAGESALGQNRLRAGVCGGPIRMVALEFIESAKQVNDEEKLGLTLMATGGITKPEHFDLFFERGADVALSAIGMMWDPYLGMRWTQKRS